MDNQKKIIRVLIVSSNQESCENFAKWLSESDSKDGFWITSSNNFEIRSYIKWPGCPKTIAGAPVADAMIIVVNNEKEFHSVREILHEKKLIGYKIAVWGDEIPQLNEEFSIGLSIKNSEKSNKIIILTSINLMMGTLIRKTLNYYVKNLV